MYAAYKAASEHKGQPTVILAKTVKGYGLGPTFEGRNATHQMKKLTLKDLKSFRDEMGIPISDATLEENPYLPPYYHPGQNDEAIEYLQARRRELGGYIPERKTKHTLVSVPDDSAFSIVKKGSGKQEVATTMAFARLLKDLLRAPDFGHRIVPIIPDEARTFGMDAYFPTSKIYNPNGQHYTSVDREQLLAYKESPQGQIIHVGINEAGAFAAFTATGTSYSTQGEPLIPVYVFYSMFGFQRTGDAMWAAGDQMARGFIIGATAGRTTLTGEGLQHADGHSHLLASTNTAVVSYDPAYGYEIGHIVKAGLERMYGTDALGNPTHHDPNVMYYLTVYNEPMQQPVEPENLDVDGVLHGIYKLKAAENLGPRAQLLASGVGVPWALEAQQLLAEDWNVAADVWSVTSWTELRRDGLAAEEHNFLNPNSEPKTPYLTTKLQEAEGPFIAVSDFMHAVQDQIRQFVPGDYYTLGADGFGFSDTRASAPCRRSPAAARSTRASSSRRSTATSCTTSPPAPRARPAERADPVVSSTRTQDPAAKQKTLAWLRTVSGEFATATIKKLDETLPWYGSMPPGRRSAVGLVAQAGITSFISWFDDPRSTPWIAADVFGAAPRELLRSVSLQQTLQLIRVTCEVVEDRVQDRDPYLREAILLYSREIAFAAADVYARAAEARGLWDARLEALVVDSILSGEYDDELPSRIAALGWHGHGEVSVLVGTAPRMLDVDVLRRTARHLDADVLIGVQGSRLVLVIGRAETDDEVAQGDQGSGAGGTTTTTAVRHRPTFTEIAIALEPGFGDGPLVLGHEVPGLVDASGSAKAALAGFAVARAWRNAPRPAQADDLLPERALAGDPVARGTLVNRI